ncbi:MAG: CocE/NonD family hydrolase [Flavitalea sp.]
MKYFYAWFLMTIAALACQAQSVNNDSAWVRNNYIKKEVYITMRDGVRLFTSMYIPADSVEKHPLLLTRTPFSCAPYGDRFDAIWNNSKLAYLREKYIIVNQDVRGKFMSEGLFEDIRPFIAHKKSSTETDESTDAFDTVDWLIKNIKGNNGKAGVTGVSYNGFYASQAAICEHHAIVAVSPQAPVTDWFMGDDFHRNGALALFDAFRFFTTGFGSPRPSPVGEWPDAAFTPPAIDAYDFFLRAGALPNLTKLTGDTIAFWKQMMLHTNYDAWWKARDMRTALFNIKPAMLLVGGFFDAEDLFGPLNTFKAISKQSPATTNLLALGPWYHGQWTRDEGRSVGYIQFGGATSDWYMKNIEIPFFNYYLKGKGSVEDIGKANIFFSGENNWKKFTAWPPSAAIAKPLYLQEGGKLSWQKPSSIQSSSSFTSDPSKPVPYIEDKSSRRIKEYMTADQRFASQRTDVLVFETESLTHDLTLAGPITADLTVSASTTDADFVVKLIDVFPDDFKYDDDDDTYLMGGYQMLVRGDVLRGRFRNSFEKPEPLTPGKIAKIKFSMNDVAHTFKKGHRIMVHIQSSWFPLIDRNPQQFINIYQAVNDQFIKSTIRIFHDRNNTSGIILPVME